MNNEKHNNEWPRGNQFKKSIRLEFSIYISIIVLLMMSVTGYIITDQFVKSVTQNATEKLLVQARSYSGPAGKHIISVNGPDALMLSNICKKLVEDNSDIYWAGIAGSDGVFLAHTDINQVIGGRQIPEIKSRKSDKILRDGEAFALSGDSIFISVPIYENDIELGLLVTASSNRQIVEARRVSITTVVTITFVILLLGLPITMIMMHRKLRPISIITDRLKEISIDDIELNIPIKSRNEFGYLAETLNVMGKKLNDARREMLEKERITRELEIAQEIQANILPRSFPKTDNFESFGIYSSAREVGGDYYDFIDYGDEHLGFLVADVSGKSLPGMLVMLLTRDIVKRLTLKIKDPVSILSKVNEDLLSNIKKGMFVTMFYGLFNKKTGEFTFASAGHNPLIRIDNLNGRTELIKTKGFPLGMISPEKFDQRIERGHLILGKNDWLVQYTDGINEGQNSAEEEYGMDRFMKALEACKDLGPVELINGTILEHKEFVGDALQYDDITLLALKWTGESSGIYKDSHLKEVASEG